MSLFTRAQVALFRSLPAEHQRALIAAMTPVELLQLDACFELYAHDGQHPPEEEGWRVWLMMAGRGFGKTRAGAEWISALARKRGLRIALVAASIDEARSVMVEGASGLLSVARTHGQSVKWEPSLKQLKWPSGTIAHLYSGDHADGLRGPEHHLAWFDEVEAAPDPAVHAYRLRILGAAGSIERDSSEQHAAYSASEIAALGAGPIEIQVRQVGELLLSRPAIITINA